MASAPAQNATTRVIYSMQGISKQHEKKVILKDIYLSYYYGAKIGVLGLNGAGKSSLLKVVPMTTRSSTRVKARLRKSSNHGKALLPRA